MTKAIFLTITMVLLFVGLQLLCYYLTGWSRLARAYRFRGNFQGQRRWYFRTAWMGFGTREKLNIAVNESGLHLSVIPPFHLFYPPLFIPWEHVSAAVHKGWFDSVVEFNFRDAPPIYLSLASDVGRELLEIKNQIAEYQADASRNPSVR